jgi:exodeoxyribonuclease VII large subunit
MDQIQMSFDNLSQAAPAAPTEPPPAQETPVASKNEPQILSVSDVNKAVRSTLESQYRMLWVQGEISNFKAHSSGHFYFSLKDSKAQISAVMFKGFNQGMKFRPHDGLEVIVRGKITVYEPRGNYQLFCELMEPMGAGALQMAFEQLKKKLQSEGLFDQAKKRPLPSLPKHVVVVTSPTGAAIRDILNVLGRRFAGLRVTLIPAVVQGDAAPAAVVRAIQLAHELPDVDVMIVGRGGGSIEDLWCFNDERVARAIASSRIPTISAVGHEIDFTIADFVADLRAPTPSAAAELVCRNAIELCHTIKKLEEALLKNLRHRYIVLKQRAQHAAKRLVDPKRRLQDLAIRCDDLDQRLELAWKRGYERRLARVEYLQKSLPSPDRKVILLKQRIVMEKSRLEAQIARLLHFKTAKLGNLASVLDSMSPLKVVERGYSIARKAGQVVRSSTQIKKGDRMEVVFAHGSADVLVENVKVNRPAQT